MDYYTNKINSVIFCEGFWLGDSGYSWKDFENKPDGILLPEPRNLVKCLLLAPLLVFLRKLVETYAVIPLGFHYGIPPRPRKPSLHRENSILQTSYKKIKNPNKDDINVLAKRTDLTPRQIERWFRDRRRLDRVCQMQKFQESVWTCVCYTILSVWGLNISFKESWFENPIECFVDITKQELTPGIYWFYISEVTVYISFLLTQPFDVKRKDSYQMVIHHLATLFLLWTSWSLNFVRIGVFVCVLHDTNDIFLQLAKALRHMKKELACTFVSYIFILSWFVTRIYLFPTKIIWTILFEARNVTGHAPIFYLFSGLLVMIQILNFIWTYLILNAIWIKIKTNQLDDVRSSDEEESDNDNDEEIEVNDKNKNGFI